METLRIFVASSTEGVPIATELASLLQTELGSSTAVEVSTNKFTLGATKIEALERIRNEADFAVLVMTLDDINISRLKNKSSPLDNLVFQLGLFIGALGRDRLIIARESEPELNLYSDILGVTALTYNSGSPSQLSTSLQAECMKLAPQVKLRGLRSKFSTSVRTSLPLDTQFCHQVEGAWWERINYPQGSALGYVTITANLHTGNLDLEGKSYGKDALPSAKWRSEMTRLYPAERKIIYFWRGTAYDMAFHGYGTKEFNLSEDSSSRFVSGRGDFWNVNEAQPNNTIVKSVELRRVLDEKDKQIMTSGADREKHDLVLNVIEAW